ncbi:MAG: bi-domain-containing oxidoreductase [Anaerolineales bacterium]|jgi:predicted dehydrogenase/threonine dehydrogenase-like Zn-dependent dehydrogenase
MKQLLQNMKTGQTAIEEVPTPMPAAGQALVKVSASLVSAGTERMLVEFAGKSLVGKARSRPDLVGQVFEKMRREGMLVTLGAAFNRLDQPMPLGYSSAGSIAALGDEMVGFNVGQRVACAGGGYAVHAEYNVIPRNLLTPLPDSVDFESAAFTTLGAIAMHGFRLAQPQIGETVAVIGLGLLGLLTAQIAAAAGCRVLGIDINPQRIGLAATLGLGAVLRDQAVDSARVSTSNRGFDIVIICADTTSNDPVDLAAVIARDRAKVVATGAIGLTFSRKLYYEKELSFINSRSYGPGRYDASYEEQGKDYPLGYVRWTEGRNFESFVDLMAMNKLKISPMITHRFPIERAAEAYEIITGKKKEPFLGIVLTYPNEMPVSFVSRITFPVSVDAVKHDTLKLGVLGAGLFANATLLPALKNIKQLELVGIGSAAGVHARYSAKKFGFAYATSDDDEILNDPNINSVAILTRHGMHAGLVARSLQSGKHVFVEKPLAITAEQLEIVNQALTTYHQKLLMVGFNRRFAPLTRRLREFLVARSEPLFMHYRINAGYIPLNHWTHDPVQGGGRIIGEGCHFVDYLTCLVGAAPLSVSASALPDNGRYCEDNVTMTFHFPDDSIGVVDYLANGDKSFSKERLEVFCGGRIAVLDDFRTLEMIQAGRRSLLKRTLDKGWKDEWIAFSNAICTGSQPPIPYEQLFGVTKATFAAVQALREGQEIRITG